jgi:hypothetical protein
MNDLICGSELPKGMEPPEVNNEAPEKEEKKPAPVSLAQGNYIAAIHQALSILPVEVNVEKCLVVERAGRPPQVRLDLVILGEKDMSPE